MLDGWDEDERKVYEFKNRMRRLFGAVPRYEMPQLQAYMFMMESVCGAHVESHRNDRNIHEVWFDGPLWAEIRGCLDTVVDSLFERITE